MTTADFDAIQPLLERDSPFDAIVVDEAQDLLTAACMSRIGRLVRGGLGKGRWRMFLDPNNQSGLHEPMDPHVLDDLRGVAAQHKLRRNCRNTQQIVLQTRLLTGADIGVAVIEGRGPPIEISDVVDARSGALLLERRITDWLDSGVRPGHITILSPGTLSESAVRFMTAGLVAQVVSLDFSMASSLASQRAHLLDNS